MRKFVAIAAAAIALGAGPVWAGTIENSFGNTMIVTSADGAQSRFHIEPDGTFAGTAPDGSAISGTYAVRGDQLCSTTNGGAETCSPYVADKNVGDTWTETDHSGVSVTVSIQAGR